MNPSAAAHVAQPAEVAATVFGVAATPRTNTDREAHRTPYRVPCRVRFIHANGETRTLVGETVNLSAGGVGLRVSIDVPKGTWVEALIPRLQGEPLFLNGVVMHCRRTLVNQFEIGVAVSSESDPSYP